MKIQDLRKMQTLLFLLTKGTALNYDTSWSCTFPPLMAMLIWSSLIAAASCTPAGLSVAADGTVSVAVEVADSSFSGVVDVGLSCSVTILLALSFSSLSTFLSSVVSSGFCDHLQPCSAQLLLLM